RIGVSGHVVVRRVAGDDVIGGRIVDRVAPFGEVADGQRQAVVEGRVEGVDERNACDHAGEQVGPHVGDRSYHQAAGGGAAGDDPPGRVVAGPAEIFGHRDEIGE